MKNKSRTFKQKVTDFFSVNKAKGAVKKVFNPAMTKAPSDWTIRRARRKLIDGNDQPYIVGQGAIMGRYFRSLKAKATKQGKPNPFAVTGSKSKRKARRKQIAKNLKRINRATGGTCCKWA